MKTKLLEIYDILHCFFGPQKWWPGDTPFEVMLGAVLTQNTSWTNASRAIDNLREDKLLSFGALDSLPLELLAAKIRPSGYYNQKALRIKSLLKSIRNFVNRNELCRHGSMGSIDYGENDLLDIYFNNDLRMLRELLLSVKGIGPETADSIILYAANKPTFVIDAYTHRILARHSVVEEDADYDELQALFMDSLPCDVELFNEYHALFVMTGKNFCKKTTPLCDKCPLRDI